MTITVEVVSSIECTVLLVVVTVIDSSSAAVTVIVNSNDAAIDSFIVLFMIYPNIN